jgi:hypothetical protein
MLKQAANKILERYVKLAECELNATHRQYSLTDLEKTASQFIKADIARAILFDKVAMCDAFGRSFARVLVKGKL